MTFGQFPDISLTAVKFFDIFRLSTFHLEVTGTGNFTLFTGYATQSSSKGGLLFTGQILSLLLDVKA